MVSAGSTTSSETHLLAVAGQLAELLAAQLGGGGFPFRRGRLGGGQLGRDVGAHAPRAEAGGGAGAVDAGFAARTGGGIAHDEGLFRQTAPAPTRPRH